MTWTFTEKGQRPVVLAAVAATSYPQNIKDALTAAIEATDFDQVSVTAKGDGAEVGISVVSTNL